MPTLPAPGDLPVKDIAERKSTLKPMAAPGRVPRAFPTAVSTKSYTTRSTLPLQQTTAGSHGAASFTRVTENQSTPTQHRDPAAPPAASTTSTSAPVRSAPSTGSSEQGSWAPHGVGSSRTVGGDESSAFARTAEAMASKAAAQSVAPWALSAPREGPATQDTDATTLSSIKEEVATGEFEAFDAARQKPLPAAATARDVSMVVHPALKFVRSAVPQHRAAALEALTLMLRPTGAAALSPEDAAHRLEAAAAAIAGEQTAGLAVKLHVVARTVEDPAVAVRDAALPAVSALLPPPQEIGLALCAALCGAPGEADDGSKPIKALLTGDASFQQITDAAGDDPGATLAAVQLHGRLFAGPLEGAAPAPGDSAGSRRWAAAWTAIAALGVTPLGAAVLANDFAVFLRQCLRALEWVFTRARSDEDAATVAAMVAASVAFMASASRVAAVQAYEATGAALIPLLQRCAGGDPGINNCNDGLNNADLAAVAVFALLRNVARHGLSLAVLEDFGAVLIGHVRHGSLAVVEAMLLTGAELHKTLKRFVAVDALAAVTTGLAHWDTQVSITATSWNDGVDTSEEEPTVPECEDLTAIGLATALQALAAFFSKASLETFAHGEGSAAEFLERLDALFTALTTQAGAASLLTVSTAAAPVATANAASVAYGRARCALAVSRLWPKVQKQAAVFTQMALASVNATFASEAGRKVMRQRRRYLGPAVCGAVELVEHAARCPDIPRRDVATAAGNACEIAQSLRHAVDAVPLVLLPIVVGVIRSPKDADAVPVPALREAWVDIICADAPTAGLHWSVAPAVHSDSGVRAEWREWATADIAAFGSESIAVRSGPLVSLVLAAANAALADGAVSPLAPDVESAAVTFLTPIAQRLFAADASAPAVADGTMLQGFRECLADSPAAASFPAWLASMALMSRAVAVPTRHAVLAAWATNAPLAGHCEALTTALLADASFVSMARDTPALALVGGVWRGHDVAALVDTIAPLLSIEGSPEHPTSPLLRVAISIIARALATLSEFETGVVLDALDQVPELSWAVEAHGGVAQQREAQLSLKEWLELTPGGDDGDFELEE